jgi:hypothetical protein
MGRNALKSPVVTGLRLHEIEYFLGHAGYFFGNAGFFFPLFVIKPLF